MWHKYEWVIYIAFAFRMGLERSPIAITRTPSDMASLTYLVVDILATRPQTAGSFKGDNIMMTSSNWSIFRVTGHLWEESTGDRWKNPSQRPVTRSFAVFFDLRLNKRLSKQSRRWWFETPSRSLWRHLNYASWFIRCRHWTIHNELMSKNIRKTRKQRNGGLITQTLVCWWFILTRTFALELCLVCIMLFTCNVLCRLLLLRNCDDHKIMKQSILHIMSSYILRFLPFHNDCCFFNEYWGKYHVIKTI